MDYEKKYKEALEKARQLCAYPTTKPFISDLQDIFPELTESEDEKIRKEIVNTLHSYAKRLEEKIPTEWFVWLEKQGEHKCDCKYVGCHVNNMKRWCHKKQSEILCEKCNTKCSEYLKQGEQKPNKCMYSKDNYTDKDRKVLCDGCEEDCKFKQKPVDNVEPKFKKGDVIRRKDGDGLEWAVEDLHKDGYYTIFNSDRDDFVYLDDNWELVRQKPAELPKGEDYGIDGLYAAIDILQKTLGKVDGYQSDDGILEHKCAIEAVNRLCGQNPAWKPSDEQLTWLYRAVGDASKDSRKKRILNGLYVDLKKLREE